MKKFQVVYYCRLHEYLAPITQVCLPYPDQPCTFATTTVAMHMTRVKPLMNFITCVQGCFNINSFNKVSFPTILFSTVVIEVSPQLGEELYFHSRWHIHEQIEIGLLFSSACFGTPLATAQIPSAEMFRNCSQILASLVIPNFSINPCFRVSDQQFDSVRGEDFFLFSAVDFRFASR